jgi:hypothetical protein
MSKGKMLIDEDFLDITDPCYHEKDLMQHVLISSVNDLLSEDMSKSEEAKLWFESDNDSYLFSYRSICEYLNLPYCRFYQNIKSVLKTRKKESNNLSVTSGMFSKKKKRLITRKH